MNPFCPSAQMPTEFFGTGNARISDISDIWAGLLACGAQKTLFHACGGLPPYSVQKWDAKSGNNEVINDSMRYSCRAARPAGSRSAFMGARQLFATPGMLEGCRSTRRLRREEGVPRGPGVPP